MWQHCQSILSFYPFSDRYDFGRLEHGLGDVVDIRYFPHTQLFFDIKIIETCSANKEFNTFFFQIFK